MTTARQGIAARSLPVLSSDSNIEVVGVILVKKSSPRKRRNIKRKFIKILRIGILGAINGLRIRKWYRDRTSEDLAQVAAKYQIPLIETPNTNCGETRRILKQLTPDLGISLGNSYIARSVFSIPRFGMINVHGEILPDFKGAQSIIWPIYEGVDRTGFTIHQINNRIDHGNILYKRSFPIKFHPTLKETVEMSLAHTRSLISEALCEVCKEYEEMFEKSSVQQNGNKAYTTPSIWQYLRILRKHRHMYNMSCRAK